MGQNNKILRQYKRSRDRESSKVRPKMPNYKEKKDQLDLRLEFMSIKRCHQLVQRKVTQWEKIFTTCECVKDHIQNT